MALTSRSCPRCLFGGPATTSSPKSLRQPTVGRPAPFPALRCWDRAPASTGQCRQHHIAPWIPLHVESSRVLKRGRANSAGSSYKGGSMDVSTHATRGEALAASASKEEDGLENMLRQTGWTKVKQLTVQEHWQLSDAHKRNWHGQWTRYIATPSETGATTYTIQENKYGIRNIEWANAEKTETFHQNHYFSEDFAPLRSAGPWTNTVAESTPEGVTHAASAAATTLYLPGGSAVWASKAVDLNAKPFSLAAELFLRPDNNTRVSIIPFYNGAAFAGVTLVREEAREPADALELRPKSGEPFWTYELELPSGRSDVAAELIGTETLMMGHGLTLYEREGRFGGYGGAQRGASLGSEGFGPCLNDAEYVNVRLPENLSVRCPKRIIEGQGFEMSAVLVSVDGMGASQCKVIYGEDWKLKGVIYGTYFA
ncbi:hypothetical protein KFL_000210080 [Klebsormidium nitens]|uniref:DUF3598 domain-containing protein n=1 Tax=Klebsormidium nitens TaxID=105231 RepID=A0A1Y1HMJ6_KLENI|nr:hypothetical protein KFL_000210080 [Klebsormidium nitens]|eukprot:GAQ78922.1 hypothetical protein KFL_000210080 [Klebsormidium nitens]